MFDFFANHTVLEGDYRLQDIHVQQELGRGNAHVYTATIKTQTYALKQIQIKNDYEYQSFLKEISNMQEISEQSPWIVQYHGYLVTKMERNQYDRKKYAYIVMECAEENLEQFLSMRRDYRYRLPVQDLVSLVEQILAALASLEEINRAHCDVKPENILIMNSKTLAIKLCDVGSSKVLSQESLQQATILGTLPFLAPELLKVKGAKVLGSRAFKSDVFSFGLVVLYMITYKKFKYQERIEIDEQTYREVLGEWIKQARELCDGESSLSEVVKAALQFDEYRRPMFKELKFVCFNQIKKKDIMHKSFIDRLEKEEEQRSLSRMQETSTYFSSQPTNQLNLFKTRRVERINFTKTISNAFKISKPRNNSPSPVKRTISLITNNSPEKSEKGDKPIGSMHEIFAEMKKVVYIGEESKNFLPEMIQNEQQKNFILGSPEVRFKRAETITMLPSCTYDVFEAIAAVQCKRLYVQTMDKEVLGVPLDTPVLRFSKVRMNLTHCDMIGGFEGLFRIIASEQLELLELRLGDTEVSSKEIGYLLDLLISQCPNLQTLLLSFQRKLISQEQHIAITEKVARLPLKKLSLLMNESYIQYEQSTRWALPKGIEILYLDYSNNLLRNVVGNLSLSLSSAECLKEVTISLQNNALSKGEVHVLIRTVSGLKGLERVMLNLAHNKIEEVKYLQTTLSLLKSINYLELRLHRAEVATEKVLELVECLKEELLELNFNLKMLKVTCDRNVPLRVMRGRLEAICSGEGTGKGRTLRCEVLGFDNHYYTLFIKKNDKLHSIRTKGGPAVKKSPKLPKCATLAQGATLSNFNSAKQLANLCYQLYTSSDSFNNYLCLTCCQQKEMNKYMHYCRFCISVCTPQCREHLFVKVTEPTRCVCAYSGHCRSDTKPVVCADRLGASLKREYHCYRCQNALCQVCVEPCRETHAEWVHENKELSYFRCRSKLTARQ